MAASAAILQRATRRLIEGACTLSCGTKQAAGISSVASRVMCSHQQRAAVANQPEQQQHWQQQLQHRLDLWPSLDRHQWQQQQRCGHSTAAFQPLQQQYQQQQRMLLVLQQQQRPLASPASSAAAFSSSSSSSSAASEQAPPGQQAAPPAAAKKADQSLPRRLAQIKETQELDRLLQVLLQPMPKAARWNAQLSPYLMQVNDQLMVQPSAVLLSVVRALQVLRGVLQEDGQVYVIGNNHAIRPLVKTAALSCINPNMWFDARTWAPGTLTNYASARRLFKESHQPNRRLFLAKGFRPVNPLCPEPHPFNATVPRLSLDDKWLLYRRTNRPGYSQLLNRLMLQEDKLHRFQPAGSLKGTPESLQLMVFLDSTKNAVAIKEAFHKNIPTIAVVNTTSDISQVTYPVLARDFSPGFTHFFLDWIVKVANTPWRDYN